MKIKEQCEECKGKGYSLDRGVLYRCPKCFGRGELDWIENIIGPNLKEAVPSDYDLIQKYYQQNTKMLDDWRKTDWKKISKGRVNAPNVKEEDI